MAETLAIRLHDELTDAGRLEWLVRDSHRQNAGRAQTTDSEAVPSAVRGRRVVVYVPTRHISHFRVKLPSRNTRKVAQALPFALEERLAEDVNTLHFVSFDSTADGEHQVAVVRRSVMENWLDRLSNAGIQPDALIPDVFLAPADVSTWSIVVETDTILVRTGLRQGFTVPVKHAPSLIELAFGSADEPAPESVTIWAADKGAPTVTEIENIASAAELPVSTIAQLPRGTALNLLYSHSDIPGSCNLLQGAYKPVRDSGRQWKRWRVAISLAIVLIAAIATWQGIGYYRLSQKSEALHARVVAIFHKALPEAPATSDMRGRLRSRLIQLKRRSGSPQSVTFLSTLAAVGKSLNSNQTIKSLDWSHGVLELQLTVPDVKDLGQLASRIKKRTGRDVQIKSARARNAVVKGRIRVARAQ